MRGARRLEAVSSNDEALLALFRSPFRALAIVALGWGCCCCFLLLLALRKLPASRTLPREHAARKAALQALQGLLERCAAAAVTRGALSRTQDALMLTLRLGWARIRAPPVSCVDGAQGCPHAAARGREPLVLLSVEVGAVGLNCIAWADSVGPAPCSGGGLSGWPPC